MIDQNSLRIEKGVVLMIWHGASISAILIEASRDLTTEDTILLLIKEKVWKEIFNNMHIITEKCIFKGGSPSD